MICQNCGALLQENAKFCPKCGTKAAEPVAQPAKTVFQHNLNAVWPEWQIIKQLGKGSYGVVYEAVRTDNNVESHAAIKVISIPTDESEVDSLRSEGYDPDSTRAYFKNIVDDFVGEIQLMESLKGMQNIVSVEDYKVIAKTDRVGWDLYIRMELLTPFQTYICDNKMTEADVIKLGMDICTALEICGQRNVIHRDIKPENIFINNFGYFKLGDFGIARKMDNMTSGLSQKGTYNYMAPEVATTNEYDARVDIYSLGIVLYRLLNNNRLPFLDADAQSLNPNDRKLAVERRMRGDQLPAPCNASPEMANLILRACAYHPNGRFATAKEMKAALTAVANGNYTVSDLEQTTRVRPAENPDATTAVRKAQVTMQPNAAPVVEKIARPEKKKKAKKGKIIAITVLTLILALVITLGVLFLTSPAFSIYQDMQDEKYEDALSTYQADVEDDFIQKLLLKTLLGNQVNKAADEYHAGKADYAATAEALDTLTEMGFKDAEDKHKEIMAEYAANTVSQYKKGELSYDKAVATLNMLKEDGYSEAAALIDQITVSQNATDAMEKADQLYADGDYENAIAEYSKVPEGDENYEDAQEKLAQVYTDHIDSTIATADGYMASGDCKKAVQHTNTAYGILPKSVDTSKLDAAKEKYLTAYKTQVADKVTALIAEEDFEGAFAAVDEAISFDSNDYFRELKVSTEESYVAWVTESAEQYMDKGDYKGALKAVTNALNVLPGNTELTELQKRVEKETPTPLNELVVIDSSRYDYNADLYTDSFGNVYDGRHSFDSYYKPYVVYNLNDKYTQFSGSFVASKKTGSSCVFSVAIYLDGKLAYTLTDFTKTTGKQDFTLDVTNVTKVEIKTSVSGSYSDTYIAMVNAFVK